MESILPSERQSEKAIGSIIPTIWHSGKGKKYRENKKINGGQGLMARVWVARTGDKVEYRGL